MFFIHIIFGPANMFSTWGKNSAFATNYRCKIKQQWSSISCLLMLGIQDYRWKKITIDNNKNSKISDSWKDWKPRTNENRDCWWKTVALEAKLQIFWQIRSFASKSVVFRQNWVFLIPFDLLLMRLPSLLSPSTHCQSWFGFCVIWSYGGHMKQVAQLVPI